MTDEIKEILEALKPHNEVKEYPLILSLEQQKTLLNYITNLQQLYENGLKVNQNSHKYITELEMNNAILKEDLDKANDIIQKDRQFYKCRMDEYAELKKENERLNNKIKEQNLLLIEFQDMEQKVDNYKSRCEKANEYMKDFIFEGLLVQEDRKLIMYNENLRKFENILNGSDENE